MKMHEVAIIGAGPAGIAASIQLARYGLDFILLERGESGGLLRNANLVENYPGFPQGISGPVLVQGLVEHMQSAGVMVVESEVSNLSYQAGAFHLYTQTFEVKARTLVIASGTKPRTFSGLHIPASLKARVFYEGYPLAQATGKHIAIIGAGDAAFDYALNLSSHNQVEILNHSEHTRCLPLLWERASHIISITYHTNTQLQNLEEGPSGEMLLDCITPAGFMKMEADYLLGALGRDPQTDFVSPEFQPAVRDLQAQGLLYWIGDVQNGRYRQTAIAVGDGVRTAMQIYCRLKEVS
ncbi:MAG: FAD-dependent pyridine nucleotide-disulfide oxidoreductase [Chloroflexi bacterium]|nr:MAG: FAD-dependent pyridine nucleotide-disulfide oxidoreductase [Chloroflexota bacterium]MBA4376597.1 hypothetical protein [Anaerolinea sp.]